jgi:hypothetical protein
MATRHGTGKAFAARELFRGGGAKAPAQASGHGGSDGPLLERVRPGEAWHAGGFELVPLVLDGGSSEPPVLLARQAVEEGALEIVERGEGVVQELLAWNRGTKPVAILEGDTLVGCKQNRVVARSVIVAPGTSLGVPVGCMERGRWRHESRRFAVGDVKMAPSHRRQTVSEVKAATLSGRDARLDQSRLWSGIEEDLEMTAVASPTSNYYDVVETAGREAREAARRRARVAGEVGVLVLRDGALVGLEATGQEGLWSALAEPTLASYLVGTHRGEAASPTRASAAEWLDRARRAELVARPGLGLGSDLDLSGGGLSGLGLALDGFTVHLAAFPA